MEKAKNELSRKHIKMSHQRVKVLEYLNRNRCHPTADRIYTDLQKDVPTLSKTTVYNTLRVLAEAGLVRAVTIEGNEVRYDADTQDHGHFKCESCGTVYDFRVDTGQITSEELAGFKIHEKNVYFKGVCPKCLSNIKQVNF